mmetsp:Transcript_39069/g.83285  ORF Transcript_39069/g.83285 Transcript_39069/m.83285 type:complete len:89 (+) Transcript_39069:125-391(+)
MLQGKTPKRSHHERPPLPDAKAVKITAFFAAPPPPPQVGRPRGLPPKKSGRRPAQVPHAAQPSPPPPPPPPLGVTCKYLQHRVCEGAH